MFWSSFLRKVTWEVSSLRTSQLDGSVRNPTRRCILTAVQRCSAALLCVVVDRAGGLRLLLPRTNVRGRALGFFPWDFSPADFFFLLCGVCFPLNVRPVRNYQGSRDLHPSNCVFNFIYICSIYIYIYICTHIYNYIYMHMCILMCIYI